MRVVRQLNQRAVAVPNWEIGDSWVLHCALPMLDMPSPQSQIAGKMGITEHIGKDVLVEFFFASCCEMDVFVTRTDSPGEPGAFPRRSSRSLPKLNARNRGRTPPTRCFTTDVIALVRQPIYAQRGPRQPGKPWVADHQSHATFGLVAPPAPARLRRRRSQACQFLPQECSAPALL